MSNRKPLQPSLHVRAAVARLFAAAALCSGIARGSTPALADAVPDYSKGALSGRVLDAVTGKPLAGATVAVLDGKGKVVAWSTTNAQGEYMVPGDPVTLLRLPESRHRGLLDQLCRGIAAVAAVPARVVDSAAKVAKDAASTRTVENLAVSAAVGNPAPIAAQVVGSTVGAVQSTPTEARKQTSEAAVRSVFGDREGLPERHADKSASGPGEAMMAISATGYKDLRDKTAAYWLVAADPTGTPKRGADAVMETVKLAPASDAKAKSEVVRETVTLADPHVEPAMAAAGSPIKIKIALADPAGLSSKVRVFAREEKKRSVVELARRQEGKSAVYSGTLALDPKVAAGTDGIVVVGLRADPVDVKLPKDKKDDPMLEFVRRLDDLAPNKPYEYDPRIFACNNRLDATIMVLDPRKGAPAPPPGAAAAPTPPGPAPSPAAAPAPSAPVAPPAKPAAPTSQPTAPPAPGKPAPGKPTP